MTPRATIRQQRSARRGGLAVLGPGRVGQALGRLLNRAGFPVRFVAARRVAAARQAAKFIGRGRPVSLESPELGRAQTFLVTTSDTALALVASELAGALSAWDGKVVLQTSGSLPASVLAPLRRKGAAIGSLHPFQTVPSPSEGVRNLRNCYWAIEGDAAARRLAGRWVRALGGKAFRIRPGQKALYHAAAFLVCPAEVTLLTRSASLLRKCGVPREVAHAALVQIAAETVANFGKLGGRAALTGPAARGDWPVLRSHLRALERAAPDLLPVYQALVRAMLRLAGKHPPRDLHRRLA